MTPWTQKQLLTQLRELGVREGGVVLVHTSFKAVAPVEGGPVGLIAALGAALGTHGTLVMPTMTDGDEVFDPARTPSRHMGITAELFWRQPGVIRSTHPGGSFAARGPAAERICAPQPLSPPHGPVSPVGVVHSLGGQVLLLGVNHSESTTLHLAEALAGVPYSVEHPCVIERDGRVETVMIPETDHCCEGFRKMDGWLRAGGRLHEGRVGNATARLANSTDIIDVALEHLKREPLVFLCSAERRCEECDRARASTDGDRLLFDPA